MTLALACAVLVLPAQTINGVKPLPVATQDYAKAYAKWLNDDQKLLTEPDPFFLGYFSQKAKSLAPLIHTKYTAAHFGLCGTMLNVYEEQAGTAIKSASDRIVKGTKDFDSLTKEEHEAVTRAFGTGTLTPFRKDRSSEAFRFQYMAGNLLGALSAHSTVWHISPKEKTLLGWIGDGVKAAAEQASAKGASTKPELAEALKGFTKFQGKTYDEATMKEIAAQLRIALRAALPEKYRWAN